MKTVKVELLAFGETNAWREVEIDAEEIDFTVLDDVFRNGQNDFCPQVNVRSVSVGDVIHLSDDEKWFVLNNGFQRIRNQR